MEKVIELDAHLFTRNQSPKEENTTYLESLRKVCALMQSIATDFEYDLKDIITDTMYLAIGGDIAQAISERGSLDT